MEKTPLDYLWVIVGSALVFMMQAGFAMVESGLTRSKNSINVAIKNLTDFGISTMVYWICGFGLMFGASLGGLTGGSLFLFQPPGVWPAVFLLFQAVFCSTAATIVSGAVAERMRFSSYIISTALLSALIYPLFGHWAWGGAMEGTASGWLAKRGFVDFAGSTVVHSLGGWMALALLLIIGPRTGRFGPDGSARTINGSSIPMAVLGVFLLWFGWIGFNGSSTLEVNDAVPGIILRTMLGGAAGMTATLGLGWFLSKKPEVGLVLNGSLAGLVAVTANCHAVNEIQAVIIGGLGGVVMLGTSALLTRLKIDDAVDAIPVHLAAGVWGTLAVGIFGDPELLGTGLSRGGQIGVQCLGILACGGLAMAVALPVMGLINRISHLRVTPEHEAEGLNKAEHGVTTEIHDLFTTLDTQARTGDITLRAPEEPFTEIGQIAGMYNSVLDKLQEGTVEKQEYLNLLENVSDGLFLLDPSLKIGPYYSSSLETIFRRGNLSGLGVMEVLSAFLDEKARRALGEFLEAAFSPDISWRHLERLNPLKEVKACFKDSPGAPVERHLEFDFRRVGEPRVERLFVLVRDLTERIALVEEIEKTRNENRREMEMLQKILHIEGDVLLGFLKSAARDAEAIDQGLKDGENSGGDFKGRLEGIFRSSHSLKGDAELLGLDFLSDLAEDLETKIAALRGTEKPGREDFRLLQLGSSDLLASLDRLNGIVERWLKLSDTLRSQTSVRPGLMEDSLGEMAKRLAGRYGKQVELRLTGLEEGKWEPEKHKVLKDILIQLVRNSVYHGIEKPEQRRKAGKDEKGLITIRAAVEGEGLRIVYRDDGAGIEGEKITRKAVQAGLITPEQAETMTEAEKVRLIFHSGFSTAENPDRVAGKGVGLSVITARIKELNGRLSLGSRRGSHSQWTLVFPLSALTGAPD
ncbi:MAG: ammonium transporter [Spirochaetales bacterium]|jgi:Amt family ammonium transporter|nr:ammonium transporter [Spirochaetales bacterium]